MSLARIPTPYVHLVANGQWSSFCVIDMKGKGSHGGARRELLCSKLGLEPPPTFSTWSSQHVFEGEAFYHDVADALRNSVLACVNNEQRKQLEKLVITTQALADDTNSDEFARRAFSSGLTSDPQHRRYRAHYLLKTLLVATSLKSISMLPQVMEAIVRLLLGEVTQQQFRALFDEAKTMVISRATVSRSRFLLDGLLMRSQESDANIKQKTHEALP